jgi:hypothetical protein
MNQHIWIYWNNFSISVYSNIIISNNIKARDVHMLFWPAEAQRRQSIAAETSRSGPYRWLPGATPWLPMSGSVWLNKPETIRNSNRCHSGHSYPFVVWVTSWQPLNSNWQRWQLNLAHRGNELCFCLSERDRMEGRCFCNLHLLNVPFSSAHHMSSPRTDLRTIVRLLRYSEEVPHEGTAPDGTDRDRWTSKF